MASCRAAACAWGPAQELRQRRRHPRGLHQSHACRITGNDAGAPASGDAWSSLDYVQGILSAQVYDAAVDTPLQVRASPRAGSALTRRSMFA